MSPRRLTDARAGEPTTECHALAAGGGSVRLRKLKLACCSYPPSLPPTPASFAPNRSPLPGKRGSKPQQRRNVTVLPNDKQPRLLVGAALRRWRDRIAKIGESPIAFIISTLLPYVGSIVFADFGKHFRDWRTLHLWLGSGSIDVPDTFFAFSLIALAVTGWLQILARERQDAEIKAAGEKSAETLAQLGTRTDEIYGAVQTLPPSAFLTKFADLHPAMHKALVSALEAASDQSKSVAERAEEVRKWIRAVLHAVAVLVKDFDNVSPLTSARHYCANLMVFRRASSLTLAHRQAIESRLRFAERQQDVSKLWGILDLATDLSTSTRSSAEMPDTLVPLALPIPSETDGDIGGDSLVLPGAPEAFVNRNLVVYDAKQMVSLYQQGKRSDARRRIANDLKTYFTSRTGKSMQSMVSMALKWPNEHEPKAVLNVHCTKKGMLQRTRRQDELYLVLQPAALILLDLLQRLDDLEPVCLERKLPTNMA